jgi:hypothetical protein
MFTKKLSTQFTASLLNAVSGVLGEATALGDTLKREREAKEKKEPNGVKTEEVEELDEKHDDVPFEGPYDKSGVRKDKYGNIIKNVAKHLAKKAMSDKANEETEHNNCGTPECCGQCDTPEQIDETAKIVAHLQKRYGDNIRKSHVRSAANDFGVDASKLAKAVRTKLGKNMLDEEEQIDEISSDMAHRYLKGKRERDYDISPDGKSSKLKKPQSFNKMNKDAKSSMRALRTIEKAKKANEDVEHTNCGTPDCCGQCDTAEPIDEISKGTLGRYINKAKDSIDTASYRQGHKEAHGSSSKPLEKKLTKRHKGIETAVKKLTKEDAEQIDELSKATMGRYVNKAADRMSTQGVTAGLKIAADEKSKKNFDTIAKRQKGIATAVSKLTKEEQDFIDLLNTDTLDEARGRPRKAGAKDFTINPKTKEKLMHDNPEHMKKIEALQRNGVIQAPKVEANQHVMQQLQRAKLSMRGGETVNFTHGDSHHVSGDHAAKLLTKYASMKPDEKEAFQKKIGHSHANLKSEL